MVREVERRALVAAHRLKRAQPVETQPTKDAAHRRRREGELLGDLLAGVALSA
jgi:hypothetical protein